jgi:serine/threonine protein kinase
VLLPEWASSPEVAARLAREAAVLGSLDHPGVVAIFDAGVDRTGTRYLVMENLLGRTLEGLLLARGRLEGESVAHLGATVADVLCGVHQAGFVHRDLKPGNIFVSFSSASGEQIKLIDFGIAAALDAAALSNSDWKTTSGELLGTPGYMPAEQILGQPVTEKNDVYALGATLYECLVGAPPYTGTTVSVVNQTLTGTPRPLAALRPDIAPAMSEVIMQALSREPGMRPSCIQLRDTLAACVGPAPVQLLAPESDPNAPIPLVRRRRHARYPFVTRVRVILPDSSVVEGRSEEVSEGGLQIRLPTDLAPGKPVRLLVDIPGQTVHLWGSPCWSRDQGTWRVFGIQLSPDETGIFPRFVQQLACRYQRAT